MHVWATSPQPICYRHFTYQKISEILSLDKAEGQTAVAMPFKNLGTKKK